MSRFTFHSYLLVSFISLLLPKLLIKVFALKIASSLTTIEYTPELVASQDYFSNGATISNGGIPNLFSDSTIDLASNAETQALVNYPSHKNLRIIYTVAQVAYRLIASKSSGVTTLNGFKGKKIGTIPATSAAYFVSKLLATAGLGDGDYTVISGGICNSAPCGAGTLPYMLAHGTVDAVGMWEPTGELALEALGASNAVIFSDRNVYREIFNLHTTSDKLANPTTRASIVSFVKALNQAEAVFANSPASVYSRVASALGMNLAVLEAVWGIQGFNVSGTGSGGLPADLLDVLVAEDVWVAKVEGRTVMARSDLASLIDGSVLREALGTSASVSSTTSTGPQTSSSVKSTTTMVISTTKTTTSAVVTTSAISGGTIPMYGQCGGKNWTGSGTCVAGSTCKYSNDYYSQVGGLKLMRCIILISLYSVYECLNYYEIVSI
jgi:hypothetical protein